MSRPSLGLGMIVRDEAHNLPNLFESIKDCFDEVHITDTGSTDNTIEIAKNFGANIHHFEWVDDFGKARNASFEPVKTDYIMWLDGDDVLKNKEAFISFRDNVMELADYWIAKYHYTSDASGNPVCTFARERIINRHRGFNWKYFIHEGIALDSCRIGPPRVNVCSTWNVTHKRTEEDLKKDRSRNLNIFIKNKDKLDSRMRYYYGKELFEAGKHVDACFELGKAITDPAMELHDRILAIQYACYAYMCCNQYDKAIEIAQSGLMISPHRAEYYTVIGDCYLKMNQWVNAIPSYNAAKNCILMDGNMSAVFFSADAYRAYPSNQIARIWANMGDFEKGCAEASECYKKFNHPETKSVLDEIEKYKKSIHAFKNATPCEDIVITTPPQSAYEWDANIAKTKSMGGSETAAIEMAYWLKKISGRPVKVFNMRQTDTYCDGVEYISNNRLHAYMAENQPWLHIAWRHNIKVTDATTYLWCHDLYAPGMENTDQYSKIMALTPFHKRYLMAQHGLPEDKIYLTRNGIKPERFTMGPYKKDPNKVVFPNSPDRGLDRAIRIMDKVRESYPNMELHVFYGIEHLPKYGHQALHDTLKKMMSERPWVKYHGATQQDKLMEHFREAVLWVYPSDWIETSCISALELLACGVYPIVRKTGGVVDTLAYANTHKMCTIVDSDCITESQYEKYVEATITAIREMSWKNVSIDPDEWSWENVARQWLEDLSYERKI